MIRFNLLYFDYYLFMLIMNYNRNSERLGRMCTSVGVTLRPVELRSLSSDPRSLLVSFFSQWLPLSSAVFSTFLRDF